MASRFDAAVEATVQAIRGSRRARIWLRSLRWCGESVRATTDLAVKDRALLLESGSEAIVLFLLVARDKETGARPIHLPLSIAFSRFDSTALEIEANRESIYLMEAERRDPYAKFVLEAFRRGTKLRTEAGDTLTFRGEPMAGFRSVSPISEGETSNRLLRIVTGSGEVVLKSYKLPDTRNREPEILGRLHARRFPHSARFLGELHLGGGKDRLVLGILTEYVDAVDLFTWLREGWRRALEGQGDEGVIRELAVTSQRLASDLGATTAALHDALIDGHPGPWRTEVFSEEDFRDAFKASTRFLGSALRRLGQLAHSADPVLGDSVRRSRAALLEHRGAVEATLRGLEQNVGSAKTVVHSDLHLAQVLRRRSGGTLLFIDFEGEPGRAPGSRSEKSPGLRDVATMVRSFAYLRHYALWDLEGRGAAGHGASPGDSAPEPASLRMVRDRLMGWEQQMVDQYTRAYLERSTLYEELEKPQADRLIRSWAMEKALYELDYELRHRPENFPIPLDGILSLATPSSGVG
jgi:maltose alpha-D-glucosyltransferase / alpha-amylase